MPFYSYYPPLTKKIVSFFFKNVKIMSMFAQSAENELIENLIKLQVQVMTLFVLLQQ